ncbi:DUF308 domain-containing protein [Cellulosimicrobium sp. NPDC055967]|uniref:DUF308 domain-containing protein n=1 Tax=Cellulosimicrobium sp. NPDC055967 TaxID=3345670 RepID=UPI0035DE7476
MSTPGPRTVAENDEPGSLGHRLRAVIRASGVVALVLGMLVLAWPTRTAQVAAAIVAVYALVVGVVYLAFASSRSRARGARVGFGLLGVLGVVVGVVALTHLGRATVWLADLVGMLVGILWIVESVVAVVTMRSEAAAPGPRRPAGWTFAFAGVSALAGVVLLLAPMWGVAALWWVLGVSLVVLGVIQILRTVRTGATPRAAAT